MLQMEQFQLHTILFYAHTVYFQQNKHPYIIAFIPLVQILPDFHKNHLPNLSHQSSP